jgi:hypothetical protein
MRKFYVHHNYGSGHLNSRFARGFTVLVQPDPDNPRNALVQGAWCSPKDNFCKKTGRSQAEKANVLSINKRKVPDLLVKMSQKTYFHVGDGAFDYLFKYML